ncbi:MAG: hypothetical protein M3Q47_05460 [Actinomycetota bacterium]|nr:hypothetical protein [Actinomycetota bacterium]
MHDSLPGAQPDEENDPERAVADDRGGPFRAGADRRLGDPDAVAGAEPVDQAQALAGRAHGIDAVGTVEKE